MIRLFLALVIAVGAFATAPASAQTRIVAVVNGNPITSYAVSQRVGLLRLTGTRGNLNSVALEELIDEKLQLDAATRANVRVADADVDRAIGDIASRVKLNASQLSQALGQQGVNISTLRDRIRAQIAFSRLVRARFQASSPVSEQDLVAALLANEDGERQIDTFEFDLTQVIVAVAQDPSAQQLSQANARAEQLRGQFTSCSNGLPMAKQTRNVVVRPFGRRTLPELTPDAQAALEGINVGRLSRPVQTNRGLVMFAVCDKKEIRSTNAAMKALEEDLTEKRGQEFTQQYLRQLRRDALIERR